MTTSINESYIYKIYKQSEVSHQDFSNNSDSLVLTSLDQSSGYIHLCTKQQISGVLTRFYKDVKDLVILKLSTKNLNQDKLKYEPVIENNNTHYFPHYYNSISFNNIEKVFKLDGVNQLDLSNF
ncbi:hypothetical protein K502DRAFT_368347 [Neoconidiobolus thromboides FSU 785]|nr:hypothetical protein K502DRAFT_368347 [Neoconidiobolus thromboides FSU 785]